MTPTTVIALCEIMTRKEVVELSGMSATMVREIVSGERQLTLDPEQLDTELIESLGLKICGCCNVRLVPKEPVDYQILTRLCVTCWKGELGSIDVYDLERVDSYNINEMLDN